MSDPTNEDVEATGEPATDGNDPGRTVIVRSPQLYALFQQFRVAQGAAAGQDEEDADEIGVSEVGGVWFEVVDPAAPRPGMGQR